MMLHYQEPNATVYCGHALDLKELPAGSVDMCITSPPYWGLRTYKTEPQIWDSKDGCEHEWGDRIIPPNAKSGKHGGTILTGKYNEAQDSVRFNPDGLGNFCLKCNAWRGELGLEPTIELYISHLIQIFNEVKRVLKKTGTCWVNIDDSYNANYRGGIRDTPDNYAKRKGNRYWGNEWGKSGPVAVTPPKSLCLIPQRFAIAMVEQGWILRNDICWNKPNPMPESVKDRFTGSWEHLYFFVKNKRYWFEQQFESSVDPESYDGRRPRNAGEMAGYDLRNYKFAGSITNGKLPFGQTYPNRNKRDVWEITTQGYPEAHFATFPEKLCETPILSGCPDAICKKCGKAREKIYERNRLTRPELPIDDSRHRPSVYSGAYGDINGKGDAGYTEVKEIGITDCGCNAGFESGVVLDPFCGSGTTLAVAKRLNRKGIGIDINPDYCKLATKRLQEIPIPMDLRV